jgi:hypothetical protein
MIIKFSKNIELSDWTLNPQPDIKVYSRSDHWHRIYKTQENQYVIGVSVKQLHWGKLIVPNYNKSYAMFYHQLSCLHACFPSDIAGDLEFAKNYVDNFLIKMSGLAAFL